jgi:ABC-type sulfate transport system substrate-binding protein
MAKTLSFVMAPDADERARAFVDFVFSPSRQQLIRQHGYSPIQREGG